MTVQELINKLQQVQDKNSEVQIEQIDENQFELVADNNYFRIFEFDTINYPYMILE